ncbi:hypothetical protein [Paenibacillus dendritiformis]|uniref:hypothetical protein n=1 Tax=Paenibacillus dendritiformis TaxID=130049 RepID=UPI0018CE09A5|nr:hypothetical protein [Paenibacillus dendritiformis]
MISGYQKVMNAIQELDLAEFQVKYACGQKLKFDLTKKYDVISQDVFMQWLSNIEWGRVVKVKWKTCNGEKESMYMPGCGGKSRRHKSKRHHHDGCKCEKCKPKRHHHDDCKCEKCKPHHPHHHECDPCRPDPCRCYSDPCCCKPRYVWRDQDPYTRFQPKPQIPYKHYPSGSC